MSDPDEQWSPGGMQDARTERLEDAWMSPEDGYETTPGPTIKDPDHIPVAYGRDVQTDARRMGQVDGSDGNIMDDRDLDDVGYLMNLNATSIGDEKRAGGWIPIAKPYGGPPPDATTSGTRGASDILPNPDDGSLP